MGLLTTLLTLPVSGPIQGVLWIAGKLTEQAEQELYDPDTVRRALVELELRYDLGEISEDEFLDAEDALLERLSVIRAWHAARAGQ